MTVAPTISDADDDADSSSTIEHISILHQRNYALKIKLKGNAILITFIFELHKLSSPFKEEKHTIYVAVAILVESISIAIHLNFDVVKGFFRFCRELIVKNPMKKGTHHFLQTETF